MAKAAETGAHTHKAIERGYAKGQLVEIGEFVPEGVTVSDVWMEKLSKEEARDLQVSNEATDPKPKDADLTQLTLPALQAMAAERGVNVKGLNKEKLIDAINAARATDAG